MTKLEFEELPPPGRAGGQADHASMARELRTRPGEWAMVRTYKSAGTVTSMAYLIRRGEQPSYQPPGAFEAALRTVQGEHRLYARYVGEPGE
jgi:hypothetical protein